MQLSFAFHAPIYYFLIAEVTDGSTQDSIVVMFDEGSAQANIEVPILDDSILEGPHAVLAEIETTDPPIDINDSGRVFTVYIVDDEGNEGFSTLGSAVCCAFDVHERVA